MSIHRSLTPRLPDIASTDVCLVNNFWARSFFPLTLGAMVVIVTEEDFRDVSRLTDSL